MLFTEWQNIGKDEMAGLVSRMRKMKKYIQNFDGNRTVGN
jgi:hypothetical protein